MAAYGALVSVMHIIDQIHRHPRPPISIHKQHVQSLTVNVKFLQQFLQGYHPHHSYTAEADPLESRKAEAAYAAEDVIESYIVDQIHSRSSDHAQETSSAEFEKGMQKVIEEMDLIKLEIKEKKMNEKKMKEKKTGVHIIKKQKTGVGSSRSSSTAQKVTTMVGLDDVLYEMLDKITGEERVRQIIPIIGMGGLGKTTLARNIYENPLIKEHFVLCAWSTISQVHDATKILREILDQVDKEERENLSEYELGEKLYKYLIGRRYFIVLDDMWTIEAWDRVRKFFPDNENGSRIVVTTRLSNLTSKFNYSSGHDMKFMDYATSWNLFSKIVFGEENCPHELEGTGKKIVEGCKGLPLSIVVVGGLLSNREPTPEEWEVVEKNLSSIVNSKDSERCLQILYMSYNNLPIHIKSCFLYLAIYEEDEEIDVCNLIPLSVLEGFVKPIDGKSLEEAAEEYLEELIVRNLILVEKRSHHGVLKEIKMHDQVRDVCLREAQKNKFLCVLGEHSIPSSMSSQRRIVCTSKKRYPPRSIIESLERISSSPARTLIGKFPHTLPISTFRLLRVCFVDSYYVGDEESRDEYNEETFIRLVNLRLLVVNVEAHPFPKIPSWVSSLWNLQTMFLFEVDDQDYHLEIWKMPLLRHVMSDDDTTLYIPDPPLSGDEMDEYVLKNLHTLFTVSNLNFSKGVLERVPNIIKLKLEYDQREQEDDNDDELGDYSLHNLCHLHKLQDLHLMLYGSVKLMRELNLPHSLKKLVLEGTKLTWEEMKAKIGCLPLLQVLKLKEGSFTGSEWETVEGQFLSLVFLAIEECDDLEYWVTDNTHFPRLEHLFLYNLIKLSEIPFCIGDIPTLQFIELIDCSDSLVESAQNIIEEQKELGNEDIHLMIR